jgi:hypothetical protein
MFRSHRTWKVKPALLLAVALTLLVVVPVSAAPPDIYDGTWEDNYMPDNWQVCPGIEVWDDEVATYRQTTYFDNQGNVKRIKIHFLGTDNFYNPENPDVVLIGGSSLIAEVDLQTGELINVRGAGYITIPGHGRALVNAGLWSHYPDGHVAGKYFLEDPDDIAAFCSYLGGE